ncbi:IQ domain-containing protein C isoform X2 [Paramormyrops kingsleyae]|uniref:IQ domain-containing protein C isoform X2 n=1 Tax=Paramormyrops kingsleyae TaxID=1676925 RepID=UPI000CD624E1|nr:IQ domain-containing protein C isoform X2 [Paramormyrops kingsleyae]
MSAWNLERRITAFQASGRGWLVRRDLGLARRDYEDIVREIEGELSGLLWRGAAMPTPRFPALSSAGSAGELSASCPGRRLGESRQETHMPEKDHGPGAPSQLCSTVEDSGPAGSESEAVPRLHVSGGRDETGDGGVSHNVAVDCNYTSQLRQMGMQRQSWVRELPRTREELRLQRSSLAMELLWVQQAIGSRKKYLMLKQGLAAPVQ